MAKKRLSAVSKVTTAGENDFIIMSTSDGRSVQIKKADLANALADVMRTVTVNNPGILSPHLFMGIFTSHEDASYDFSDPYLQSGSYGINKDNSVAGINLPTDAPRYGIMIHIRKSTSADGGCPALQAYVPITGDYLQLRVHWLNSWSPLCGVSLR